MRKILTSVKSVSDAPLTVAAAKDLLDPYTKLINTAKKLAQAQRL